MCGNDYCVPRNFVGTSIFICLLPTYPAELLAADLGLGRVSSGGVLLSQAECFTLDRRKENKYLKLRAPHLLLSNASNANLMLSNAK